MNWIELIGECDHKQFFSSRNELYRKRNMKDHPPTRAEAIALMAEASQPYSQASGDAWKAHCSWLRRRGLQRDREIGLPANYESQEIKTIAVIGAGTMGRGIAYAGAFGGYTTVVEDISPQMLEESVRWITKSFEEGVSRGKVESLRFAIARKSSLATANTVQDAIRDADLIIEAVPEEMEMKMELIHHLRQICKARTPIFASNTSSLSISEMSDLTVSRERCIGMHFFNPVPKMKLIELVKTPLTSQILWTLLRSGGRMGKEVVLVQESPGFITTRVNALIGNEAFAMLEAGHRFCAKTSTRP